MLYVLWLVLTALVIVDTALWLNHAETITDASRHDTALRLAVAALFLVALAWWTLHSQPGSQI